MAYILCSLFFWIWSQVHMLYNYIILSRHHMFLLGILHSHLRVYFGWFLSLLHIHLHSFYSQIVRYIFPYHMSDNDSHQLWVGIHQPHIVYNVYCWLAVDLPKTVRGKKKQLIIVNIGRV